MKRDDELRDRVPVVHDLVGESLPMLELIHFIEKTSRSDATVLIHGETGTGKELVARALHRNSLRHTGPFVAVNCAALPDSLLESELFGHERGAFTGAVSQRKGKFEQAEGGTLFLDEIGELSLSMQPKLLRAIEERAIDRVGGNRRIPVNIRFIAATNRDIERDVAAGRFRDDLCYRLNVLCVRTPPLRERPEDIPALAQHFLLRLAKEAGRAVRGISAEAMSILENYHWPGNVRELQNVIAHALVMGSADVVLAGDLKPAVLSRGPAARVLSFYEVINEFKRHLFTVAFDLARGDYKEAAALLGLNPSCIHRHLRNLHLTHLLRKGCARGWELDNAEIPEISPVDEC